MPKLTPLTLHISSHNTDRDEYYYKASSHIFHLASVSILLHNKGLQDQHLK